MYTFSVPWPRSKCLATKRSFLQAFEIFAELYFIDETPRCCCWMQKKNAPKTFHGSDFTMHGFFEPRVPSPFGRIPCFSISRLTFGIWNYFVDVPQLRSDEISLRKIRYDVAVRETLTHAFYRFVSVLSVHRNWKKIINRARSYVHVKVKRVISYETTYTYKYL